MDSKSNSSHDQLSKPDSIEITDRPNSMSLSDWESLELLKMKMIQSSSQEKEDIRNMIERAVNGTMSQNTGSPTMSAMMSCDALQPAIVKETACFLSQFHKTSRDRERMKMMQDSNKSEYFDEKDINAEIKNVKPRALKDIPWEELQSVWSGFEKYYNSAIEEAKKKPSCPLEVDLMLQKILEYLPRKDLLNCRLVNKSWNNSSSYVYSQHPDYVCRIRNIETFSKYSEISDKSILQKVQISLQAESYEDFCKFVTIAGPHIKNLQIQNWQMEMISTFEYQTRLKKLFENIRHLESLSLKQLPLEVLNGSFVFNDYELKFITLPQVKSLEIDSSYHLEELKFIDGLFKMIPNIEQCSLCWELDEDPTKKANQCASLAACFQTLKLRHFEYHDNLPALTFWNEMRNQKFKILRIVLPTYPKQVTSSDASMFEAFFASQSDTLEILHVESYEGQDDQPKIKLPCMKKLKCLDLTWGEYDKISPFLELESHKLPNLQEICISDLGQLECLDESQVLPKIQKLQLRKSAITDKELEIFARLRTMFPNLRQLKIDCDTDTKAEENLAIIFSFSNLEYLSLRIFAMQLKNNINCTLSGYPVEIDWLLPQLIASKVAIQPPKPSLRSMKCLKQLTLNFSQVYFNNALVIDEVGVQLGLLCLPRLDRLMLLGHFAISEDDAAELREYHSIVVISPTPDPDQESEN